MINEYLANEESKQLIERRMQEAETYRLHKRLGSAGHGAAGCIVAILVLIAVMALGLLP